jgi:hypothetical protein
MIYRVIAAFVLLAPSLITSAQPAWSAHESRRHHGSRSHHRRPAPAQRQIACTVFGCVPVPPHCTPIEGRTPSGIPTGFDVIVCRGR